MSESWLWFGAWVALAMALTGFPGGVVVFLGSIAVVLVIVGLAALPG